MRKGEGAQARSITPAEWRALPVASTDVLLTQLGLWHHTLNANVGFDLDTLVIQARRILQPEGMWYWTEVLPLEMPAHWVFRVFLSAWEWARLHSETLHALNLKLLEQG